jgi:hypothetical protein
MSQASTKPDTPGLSPETTDGTAAPLSIGSGHAPNLKRPASGVPAVYPWLLVISTGLCGLFCYLYLNKPVLPAHGPEAVGATVSQGAVGPQSRPAPAGRKPDVKPEAVSPVAMNPTESRPFEETNLRIQHILGASSSEGEDLGKLTLSVPVLYKSGVIRWTQEDVEKARSLLTRIHQFRQRSTELREEAFALIDEWDRLMVGSIPEAALRADSRTLPENQGPGIADQAALKTTETIELQNP